MSWTFLSVYLHLSQVPDYLLLENIGPFPLMHLHLHLSRALDCLLQESIELSSRPSLTLQPSFLSPLPHRLSGHSDPWIHSRCYGHHRWVAGMKQRALNSLVPDPSPIWLHYHLQGVSSQCHRIPIYSVFSNDEESDAHWRGLWIQ